MEDKIVKIMGSNFPAKNLTKSELDEYIHLYILECCDLMVTVSSYDIDTMGKQLILEKLLSPFEYWLRNKLNVEKREENAGKN